MSSSADRSRRAVTLVEVLVALAVVSAIAGVLYGILADTRQAILRGQRRVEMAAEAATILNHFEACLVTAVSPTSLDGAPTSGTLVFEPDRCAFISSRRYDGQNLIVTEISSDADVGRVLERTMPFRLAQSTPPTEGDESPSSIPADRASTLGAGRDKDFVSRMRFRYAVETSSVGDLEPVYHDRLAEGLYPRLLRVEVRVTDLAEEPPAEYEIISVCQMP